VQSGTHPTVKQAVAACLAIIPSAYNDTPVQSQLIAMRAADRDPAGGGSPVMRCRPQSRSSPLSCLGSSVELSTALKNLMINDLMSEAMGITLFLLSIEANWVVPIFVPLRMREVSALQEKKVNIRRGDIFYADLSPVLGCEQGGVRPVLVIQNDIGNKYSPTLIVAAITSKPKRELPTHVEVLSIEALQKNSVVLLEQIRTIDRIRLLEYIGSLSRIRMLLVDRALAISVGLTIAEILNDQ